MKYSVGDQIRVNDSTDYNYLDVGIIIRIDSDESFLIEFEKDYGFGTIKDARWFYSDDSFILSNSNSSSKKEEKYCKHEWREDKWFTAAVYKTCKKCGKKYEDN